MAIRTLLHFRNLDLTKDINDRYTRLFNPGVFYGGNVVPVIGQLKVEIVAPWKLISKDGMVVEESSTNTRLPTSGTLPTGQQTVIAFKVGYQENNDAIVEAAAIELSAFNLLVDKDYYVVFAVVDVPSDATYILSSYITFADRDTIDSLGRSNLRGVVNNFSNLPAAKDNIAGDLYVVADGIGGIPHIYGWDGGAWIILTDAATVTANLSTHRQNLYIDEKHATDDEKDAMAGTSGTAPSVTNPFIDDADPRIPTQNENDALQGTDGSPADYNRYITEEYPWAIPEEKAVTAPLISDISTRVYSGTTEGPVYIGQGDSTTTKNYFRLYDIDLNREYTTSPDHPTNPNAIVNITGVYFDAACTMIVDPIVSTDLDGFCNILGFPFDVYLKWDVTPDTDFRILYAKREVMKRKQTGIQFYHPYPDAFIRRRIIDAQVPASVIKAIEDIKGRDFDDVPPIAEQNTNLRSNIVGTKEYVGAVFKSDNVLNDFSRVEGVPIFANDFATNIGIPQNYSFENSVLSAIIYSYNLTTNEGTVTYGSSSVNLSSVAINQDVFIDGLLNEYRVIAFDNILKTIKIQKRNGKVPRSISTNLFFYGSLTLNSTIVTNITPLTTGLIVGMAIEGNANIPVGTLIASIDSATQITLTNAATLTSLTEAFVAVPNSQQSNFYIRGSIKKDNNPRKINLATLDYLLGRKRIYCKQIQTVANEFHPITGNVAYEIFAPLHSMTNREPRVRFYGGFKNRESGNRSRVVATNTGIISITGFFTDLYLIADFKDPSPSFTVYIDGNPTGVVVTPVNTITAPPNTVADSNGFENELDLQNQYLKVASSLTDVIPHTVDIYIGNATDDLVVYGFDLIRNTVSTVAVLPGRAFSQSDLYKKNTLDNTVSVPRGGGISYTRGRGMVSTRYVNRQLVETTQTTTMFDLDGPDDTTCPKGIASNGVPTFGPSTGLTKFSYYQAGDIVKLIIYDASPTPVAIIEQVMVIGSITASSATFTTNITTGGPARTAILFHVASTTGDIYDPVKEFNRFLFTELGVKQSSDFASLIDFSTGSPRVYTLEDGTTSIAAYNVKYVNTGIDGSDIALNMVDGTSRLRIRAVGSQLDLLVVNTGTVTGALLSIDGSPTYAINFSTGGLQKYTVWCNARYQTHEVVITNASGLDVIGFITYEPTHSVKIEGSLLATQNVIANYDSSVAIGHIAPYGTENVAKSTIIPTGSIAIDPYKMGGLFVNSGGAGTAWSNVINFTSNPYWGRYLSTTQVSAYFEYQLLGGGFEIEFLAAADRMIAEVYIDGTLATSANFPSASFKNISTSNGQVDMYIGSLSRKKFGMNNLTFGIHVITVVGTASKNGSSTGLGGINICTVYEINTSGYLSYTPSKGFRGKPGVDEFLFGLDWVRDERTFDSVPYVKDDKPSVVKIDSQTVALQDIRSDKILLSSGNTSKAVTFTMPFNDTDYFINCTVIRTDIGTPTVISATPGTISTSGFTAYFSVAIPALGTYYLIYKATKYF